MDEITFARAKQLASRPYPFQIFEDITAKDETRFIAINPDFDGCMAQGESINEALESLIEARIDLIEFLIERNLPIPEPSILSTHESYGVRNLTITDTTITEPTSTTLKVDTGIGTTQYQELIYEASLQVVPRNPTDIDSNNNLKVIGTEEFEGQNDQITQLS